VVEFGLVNRTIHQVDECVPLKDLERLTEIYRLAVGRIAKATDLAAG
jgi:succinyl-diaminopimelate desuccinylase